ncbi:hypothetical protein HBI52_172670 [Parastagonospora nodorum]|nr:hypothetical protein HBI52_172670 [Parastagonospora nodorum]
MQSLILASLLVAFVVGEGTTPGRSNRMFYKRAPKDLGTWEPECSGAESACNNACYYIHCMGGNNPDANKITYLGKSRHNENNKNRHESGCRVDNPQSTSVCGAFPFSQKFSDPLARNWECDEWPPASAKQELFNTPGRLPNSLRCMTPQENQSLGGRLSGYLRATGADRDDFFRVDFKRRLASADQSKVQYCLPTPDCGNDAKQFQLVEKPHVGGRIGSPYEGTKKDNKYKLSGTVFKELYQCSVKFIRTGDSYITDAKVTNFDEKDTKVADFKLPNDGATFKIKGLPHDLQVKRTGPFGSKLEFAYAPGTTNVNHFEWDSEMEGSGRGPFTDGGKPRRFCRAEPVAKTTNKEVFSCWFPCYKNADGK